MIENKNKARDIDWEFNQDISFDIDNITINDKVFHKKFGNGIVINTSKDTAEVEFKNHGLRKVYLKFLSSNN